MLLVRYSRRYLCYWLKIKELKSNRNERSHPVFSSPLMPWQKLQRSTTHYYQSTNPISNLPSTKTGFLEEIGHHASFRPTSLHNQPLCCSCPPDPNALSSSSPLVTRLTLTLLLPPDFDALLISSSLVVEFGLIWFPEVQLQARISTHVLLLSSWASTVKRSATTPEAPWVLLRAI
jgi:hypothetical protein